MGTRASQQGEESDWGSGEERGSPAWLIHDGSYQAEGNAV
jgi:hypothetical protein